MDVKMSGKLREVVVALLFITSAVQLFPQIGAACVSSCGKISNISYPFRLKGDPDHCGDKKYELECKDDDVVVLRLYSAEFYVKSINHNNGTIRLVDPNLYDSNCSFLPRYFLYGYNFSDFNVYYRSNSKSLDGRFRAYQSTGEGSSYNLFLNVIYMRCETPVSDDYYWNTTSCLDDPHIYAIPGDIELEGLRIGCHVIATTPWTSLNHTWRNDYEEFHRQELVLGFEVSWLHSACERICGTSSCYFNDAIGQVGCIADSHSCHYVYITTQQCGKLIKSLRYARAILYGILNGMYCAITFRSTSEFQDINDDAPFHPYLIALVNYGWYGLISFMAVRVLLGVTFVTVLLIFKWRKRHSSVYENIEHFLQDSDLMPIRYSYKEIKKMTRGFKDKLGEGGFGTVYKGKLRSGPYVAIKMLGKSKANGQEFISEVATIGRIHHIHVARLIGFCVEDLKRALVYEFMPNGSLDKFIFSKEGQVSLSYDKIYEISLGIARGIAYLHHGCDKKILHFDIKPHNILLDENFIPKISDFGLAKLYPTDDSIVTLTAAKGTIGYMAPELFYKNIGGVSYKADVYSFGMLLMEMASRRRNSNPRTTEHSSQHYFPLWIYDQFNQEKNIEIEDLSEEEKDLAKKMFIVAWWCIQLKPGDRPSMNKVIEMLDAEVESLNIPPKPLLYPNETAPEEPEFNTDQTSSNDYVYSSTDASKNVPENSACN